MSVLLMSAVFEMDLAPVPKLILLALADFANDEGLCWPTQERIAKKASTSVRRTRGHLHEFETDGLIEVIERAHGPGTRTIYRLRVTQDAASSIQSKIPDVASSIAVVNAGRSSINGGHGVRRKGDAASQGSIIEPSLDPSENNHIVRARAQEFSKHFGYLPTSAQAEEWANYQAAHPPDCIKWALEQISGGRSRPAPGWLRRVLAECMDEGHGPRQRKFESGNGRDRRRRTDGGATQARLDGTHDGAGGEKPLTAAERGGRW